MGTNNQSEYVEIEYSTVDNQSLASLFPRSLFNGSWLKTVVSHTYDAENHIGRFSIPRGAAIGDHAFSCSNLKSIRIPDGVVEIGDGAFSGCSSLTAIAIPKNVTRIGGEAFRNCRNLESLAIANEAARIGVSAFSGCISLKTITIAGKVAKEGDSEFYAAKRRLFQR